MIKFKTDKVLFEVIGIVDGRLKLNAIKKYESCGVHQKPSFKIYKDVRGCYVNIDFYYNNRRPTVSDKVYIDDILIEFFEQFILEY